MQNHNTLLYLFPVFASCRLSVPPLGRGHSITDNERIYGYSSSSCHYNMGNWDFCAHSFSMTSADFKSTFLYFLHSFYFWLGFNQKPIFSQFFFFLCTYIYFQNFIKLNFMLYFVPHKLYYVFFVPSHLLFSYVILSFQVTKQQFV